MSEVEPSKAEESAVTTGPITAGPGEQKDQAAPFYPPLIGGMFAPQSSDVVSHLNDILGKELRIECYVDSSFNFFNSTATATQH